MTIPTPKETPEEMERRLRAKIKADEPESIPPSLEPANARAKTASSGGMGGMKQYFMMAGIALIVAYLVVTFVAVTPMNTSLKTVKTTADAALTSANTAITNANKAQVTADGVANNVSNAQSSVTDLTNKITTINGQISTLQSSIATINNQGYVKASQIAGMATADQVNALNKTILDLQAASDGLKAQLAIDEANLTAAQVAIKALQTTTTTTPTTTLATTTTVSNVTTALVGNAFTGSTLLNFTAMPINTAVTQSFAFNIINATSASITNVQLAIGLEILDSSNNVVMAGLPTDATVTITSGGLATMWVAQSTGYKYLLGFTNTSTSGIFGGIGVITQGVGTTQYSVTVTVNSGATNPVPAFQLYPIVKVVSFE